MFEIYGDYGYTSETLLCVSESLSDARRWVDGYTRDGQDMAGYNTIEVIQFAEDGEALIEYRVEEEQEYFY